MTTQSVVSGAGTTRISVLITSHGVFRVIAPNGRVVAVNAGQETFAGDRILVGTDWIQSGDDELVSVPDRIRWITGPPSATRSARC